MSESESVRCPLCDERCPRERDGRQGGVCVRCEARLDRMLTRCTPGAAWLLEKVEKAWAGRIMSDSLRLAVRQVAEHVDAGAPPDPAVRAAAERLLLSQPELPGRGERSPAPPVRTYRYFVSSTPDRRDGWSVVFADSHGALTVVSDYGNWGHYWHPSGWRTDRTPDFRQFLLAVGSDYLARKIGSAAENDGHDPDLTGRAIRDLILELRRKGKLTKQAARDEWERVPSAPGEVEFHDWCGETELASPYELQRTSRAHCLEHWTTVSFERIKELIREELALEAAGQ